MVNSLQITSKISVEIYENERKNYMNLPAEKIPASNRSNPFTAKEKEIIFQEAQNYPSFDPKIIKRDIINAVFVKDIVRTDKVRHKLAAEVEHIHSHSYGGKSIKDNGAYLNGDFNNHKKENPLYTFTLDELENCKEKYGVKPYDLKKESKHNIENLREKYNLYFERNEKRQLTLQVIAKTKTGKYIYKPYRKDPNDYYSQTYGDPDNTKYELDEENYNSFKEHYYVIPKMNNCEYGNINDKKQENHSNFNPIVIPIIITGIIIAGCIYSYIKYFSKPEPEQEIKSSLPIDKEIIIDDINEFLDDFLSEEENYFRNLYYNTVDKYDDYSNYTFNKDDQYERNGRTYSMKKQKRIIDEVIELRKFALNKLEFNISTEEYDCPMNFLSFYDEEFIYSTSITYDEYNHVKKSIFDRIQLIENDLILPPRNSLKAMYYNPKILYEKKMFYKIDMTADKYVYDKNPKNKISFIKMLVNPDLIYDPINKVFLNRHLVMV